MASNSDFLSWDDSDINLDLLLGEYTASDIDSDSENPPPKKTKKDNTKYAYKCPECDCSYASVSGFRGHLRKNHSLSNIKLSDHRTKQPGKAVQQTPKLSMKDSDLQELLDTSFSLALTDIISCPIRNSSSRGQGIISLANAVEHNSASKQDLIKVIKPEFINIITASELNTNTDLNVNERLFNEFYQFTTNKTVKTEMTNIILKLNNATSQPPIKQFLAILQDAVITNFIQERSKLYNKKADEPSQVSDTDQSVLFYIAGYIINALKKQTKRQKTDKQKQLQIQIDNIISNDQSSTKTFVKKHAEWTRKLDRGGLTIPGDNFFLLIREFEICYRKHVDINSITALSLDKPKLISIILDDFMVNYYWDNLCTSDNKEFLLEKCIHLFLSIRGHSTARHIKLRLQEKKDAAAKKPLRQSLKDISN